MAACLVKYAAWRKNTVSNNEDARALWIFEALLFHLLRLKDWMLHWSLRKCTNRRRAKTFHLRIASTPTKVSSDVVWNQWAITCQEKIFGRENKCSRSLSGLNRTYCDKVGAQRDAGLSPPRKSGFEKRITVSWPTARLIIAPPMIATSLNFLSTLHSHMLQYWAILADLDTILIWLPFTTVQLPSNLQKVSMMDYGNQRFLDLIGSCGKERNESQRILHPPPLSPHKFRSLQ